MQENELLFDYEDWSIYYDKDTNAFIYEDKETNEFKHLELIATFIYTIDNQPQCADETLFTLFDNFCCGERTDGNYLYYQWFKEIKK